MAPFVRTESAAMISAAIWLRGATRLKALSSAAERGIPYTAQLSASCPTVQPPASRMAFMPFAPSAPIPVRITPIARFPKTRATECMRTSTEGVWSVPSGDLLTWVQ